MPLPTPLVVKNGSVARLNVSSSIPVPLSRTDKANISAGFQDPLICLQGYKDVLIDDDMRVLALRRATLLGADEFWKNITGAFPTDVIILFHLLV